jgi:hypothetical protein
MKRGELRDVVLGPGGPEQFSTVKDVEFSPTKWAGTEGQQLLGDIGNFIADAVDTLRLGEIKSLVITVDENDDLTTTVGVAFRG